MISRKVGQLWASMARGAEIEAIILRHCHRIVGKAMVERTNA